MRVILASRRDSDREMLDRVLAEPACPVSDVLHVDSVTVLLRHLRERNPDLVLLGFDLTDGGQEALAPIWTGSSSANVLLLVDDGNAHRVPASLAPEVSTVVIRDESSASELADAIGRVVAGSERPERVPPVPIDVREYDHSRLREVFEESPAIIATFRGPDHVFEMTNPQYLSLIGDRDVIGRSIREALPEVEGQGYFELMDRAYETGKPVGGRDRALDIRTSPDGPVERRYVTFVYQPLLSSEEEVVGLVAHGVDVTEEVESQERLDETSRLLNGIVESVPDAVYAKDREGRYLMINSAGAALFDLTVEEVVGRMDDELFRETDAARIREDDREVLRSGRSIHVREQVRTHHGEERYFDVTKAPLRDGDGATVGVVGISREITERKRAEEALEASREKYRKLFQTTPQGIALSTLEDGRFIEVNEGFETLLGYERGELIDRCAPDIDIWVDEGDRDRLMERIREEGSVRQLEARLRRKDGETIEAEISGEAIEVDDVPSILTVTRDVTEERKHERELDRSREKLRRYAAHLTSAREQERTELARDIHDHLGQLLTGVKLKIARMARASDLGQAPEQQGFESIVELVDEAVEAVRDLSGSLRPSALDQIGLVDAVRWQVERAAEQFGFEGTVQSEVEELQLEDDEAIHVFRVVQEALTNVGRHAHAARVLVKFEVSDGLFTLRVLDDGVGIDAETARAVDSHGVMGMEERALVLGGEITLRIRSEGGTELRLEVPYPKEA